MRWVTPEISWGIGYYCMPISTGVYAYICACVQSPVIRKCDWLIKTMEMPAHAHTMCTRPFFCPLLKERAWVHVYMRLAARRTWWTRKWNKVYTLLRSIVEPTLWHIIMVHNEYVGESFLWLAVYLLLCQGIPWYFPLPLGHSSTLSQYYCLDNGNACCCT